MSIIGATRETHVALTAIVDEWTGDERGIKELDDLGRRFFHQYADAADEYRIHPADMVEISRILVIPPEPKTGEELDYPDFSIGYRAWGFRANGYIDRTRGQKVNLIVDATMLERTVRAAKRMENLRWVR